MYAGWFMDILRRSNMLITSGSERVKSWQWFLENLPICTQACCLLKPNVNFFLIFLFSCVVKLNFFSCGIYFISLEGPQLSWDVDIKIHSLKQMCWWLWIYENHICELWFYEMNMKVISAVQCSIKFSKNQYSSVEYCTSIIEVIHF